MKPAQTFLLAALLAALAWQATARAAGSELFGMQARLQASALILEIRIPALCLRLQADPSGIIVATAHLFTCEACFGAPRARSWS